ncbi:alpha/beta-hydrolase [Periconia macrospinosa]|uniref:Alpha/beta-hydrolase n=1 Tax=Periconia macrospinosa TaxID=97972 RepID=A0A2V1DNJ5_9PLEO|nr:alpha/beta-hydrolase [Periconia macrospinosa]
MPLLSVSHAQIYYELYPSSPAPHLPLLLLIHGGNGGLDVFRPVAAVLETHFRVCIYDRRGFSRSPITGPQDYRSGEARLNTDADDARALIEHLNQHTSNTDDAKPLPGAVVLGNSSGAIVALHVLTRHPDVVTTLVAHEPPVTTLLPDREAWAARQQVIYDIYRQHGHVAAMGEFRKMVHADSDPGFVTTGTEENPYFVGNIIYWFEREVLPYVHSELKLDALEKAKNKLVLVNGKETHVETPQYLCNVELGKRLGLEVKMFEGGHLAFKVDPEVFAKDLRVVLAS